MKFTILIYYLLGLLSVQVEGSGKLLVKFVTFDNSAGTGDNGQCCDGKWIFCEQYGCDHSFTVCADSFYGSSSMDSCSLGSIKTGTINNQDSVTFGDTIGETRNPLTFSFSRWQLGAKLKVYIVDNDGGVNADDYVDTVTTRFARTPARDEASATWRRMTLSDRTTLIMDVKEFCDPHWYGGACAVFCRPSRDNHYTCNPLTGAKICHQGWTGLTCNEQVNECDSSPCQNGASCIDALNAYTCSCLDGYQGKHCETDVNECAGAPCQNGAQCVNTPGSFNCKCRSGFTGQMCEEEINECVSQPCQNRGTCLDMEDRYECSCLEGYTGQNCETEIRECDSNPCVNNGSCSEMINGYFCRCIAGYTGINCQTDIDECVSSPCFGEFSQCLDMVNGYVCSCPQGLTGSHCEFDVDECASNPCLNGGTCVDQLGKFSCICESGWIGTDCRTNFDECASSPCPANHTCVDGIGDYQCVCLPGWNGRTCNEDIDECLTQPCGVHGVCANTPGSYACVCLPGWTGDLCEEKMDPCWSQPCANNGSCTSGANDTVTCNCTRDWTGDHCQLFVDDCSVTPCKNGGICNDEGKLCHCNGGWFGKHCEHQSQCLKTECQHRGVCFDSVDGPRCDCPVGYTGKLCENPYGTCEMFPCHNNGTCVSGIICQCTVGFSGYYCEDEIYDPCQSSPCLNGATCIFEPPGNYTCACLESFSGPTCSLLDTVIAASIVQPDFRGNYTKPIFPRLHAFIFQSINSSFHRALIPQSKTETSTEKPPTSAYFLSASSQSLLSNESTEFTDFTASSEAELKTTGQVIQNLPSPHLKPISSNILSTNNTVNETVTTLRADKTTKLVPDVSTIVIDNIPTTMMPDASTVYIKEKTTVVSDESTVSINEITTMVPDESTISGDEMPDEYSLVIDEISTTMVPEESTVVTDEITTTIVPEESTVVIDEITTTMVPKESTLGIDEITSLVPEESTLGINEITSISTNESNIMLTDASILVLNTSSPETNDEAADTESNRARAQEQSGFVTSATSMKTSADELTTHLVTNVEASGSGSFEVGAENQTISGSGYDNFNEDNSTTSGKFYDNVELTTPNNDTTTIPNRNSTAQQWTTTGLKNSTATTNHLDASKTTYPGDNGSADESEYWSETELTVRETPVIFTIRVTEKKTRKPTAQSPSMTTDFSFDEEGDLTTMTTRNKNDHDLPPKSAEESAFILLGTLKGGDFTWIKNNLRTVMADHLKTKLRNIDVSIDARECFSDKGNPLTVLLVTMYNDGKLVYSDVISGVFMRMSDEQFQNIFPLPVHSGEECLPTGIAAQKSGTNRMALYTIIGMFGLLVASAIVIIFIAIRRKRSRKMVVNEVKRRKDDPLQSMTPLYRHYRESGIVLPPSPAGQTITVNPTFSPDNKPLQYEQFFGAVDNNYEEPLLASENQYEEIAVPHCQSEQIQDLEGAHSSTTADRGRPKLVLDLTRCNLEWIDGVSNQNLYENPR